MKNYINLALNTLLILTIVGNINCAKKSKKAVDSPPQITTITWSKVADMPTPRTYLQCVAVNGFVYAIGGSSVPWGYLVPLSTVERYNPATDLWENVAPLKTPRFYFGVCELNGKIYVAGGNSVGPVLNQLEIYDPEKNTWTLGAPMPTARQYLALASANGKIYAIGGYNGTWLSVIEEYNPQTNKWSTKKSHGVWRHELEYNYVSLNDKIYLEPSIRPTYVYNPSADSLTWISFDDDVIGPMCVVGDRIYWLDLPKTREYGAITKKTAYIPTEDIGQFTYFTFGRASLGNNIYFVGGQDIAGNISSGVYQATVEQK